MKSIRALHPPLFALYIPLTLYSANAGIVPWSDIVVPALCAVASVSLLWYLLCRLLKDQIRAASIASVTLVCFFSHTAALEFAGSIASNDPSAMTNLIRTSAWIGFALLVIGAAGWKGKHNQYVNQFLNIASSILVAISLFSIVAVGLKRSSFRPNSNVGQAVSKENLPNYRPDVFYIILDGYGSDETFRNLYGFDNSEFFSGLSKRGFYIAPKANSNFCETEISLASSLNYAGTEGLRKPQGDSGLDRIFLDKMIDQSKVSQQFRNNGYEYIAVTTGFPSLMFEPADYVLKDGTRFTLFLDALLAKTPIRYSKEGLEGRNNARRNNLISGFDSLKILAKRGIAPRFVVAHILAPHPPFVFGPIGESVHQKLPFGLWDGDHYMKIGGTIESYREGYVGQLQYVNRKVLESIDAIMAALPDSIIILQADHGPKSEANQNMLAKTNVNELFGILYAVRGPDKIQRRFYSSITPINTFRIVLSELFGLDLKLADDNSYFSGWESPLVFEDVTARLN